MKIKHITIKHIREASLKVKKALEKLDQKLIQMQNEIDNCEPTFQESWEQYHRLYCKQDLVFDDTKYEISGIPLEKNLYDLFKSNNSYQLFFKNLMNNKSSRSILIVLSKISMLTINKSGNVILDVPEVDEYEYHISKSGNYFVNPRHIADIQRDMKVNFHEDWIIHRI